MNQSQWESPHVPTEIADAPDIDNVPAASSMHALTEAVLEIHSGVRQILDALDPETQVERMRALAPAAIELMKEFDEPERFDVDSVAEEFGVDLTTPAPLDPSKVAITLKGGDYIEAESDGAKIGGKVSHVTERGFVAVEHLGEFAIHHITASPQADRYRWFTLTDHQPAPKPEWEPGTKGTADLTNIAGGNKAIGLPCMKTNDGYAFPGTTIGDDSAVYRVSNFVPDETRPTVSEYDLIMAIADDSPLHLGSQALASAKKAAARVRRLLGEVTA